MSFVNFDDILPVHITSYGLPYYQIKNVMSKLKKSHVCFSRFFHMHTLE